MYYKAHKNITKYSLLKITSHLEPCDVGVRHPHDRAVQMEYLVFFGGYHGKILVYHVVMWTSLGCNGG